MPNHSHTPAQTRPNTIRPFVAQTSLSTSEYLDSRDRFDATTAQLRSLLALISGEGFAAFKNLSDDNQQRLIWLASDLTDQIESIGIFA